ncbi:MAG: GIY-YIG nuclease family protein [Chloroflexi bacterium]|nr:GIY-YIG nuclease family protein [Chloroflexota bacterium]
MNPETVIYEGKSGKNYEYWIYPIDTLFMDIPGNYVFAKETSPKRWRPIYIGQTSNLQNRLSNHEKEACAKRHGATHIHAHTSSYLESTRKAEESDLIAQYMPECNERIN